MKLAILPPSYVAVTITVGISTPAVKALIRCLTLIDTSILVYELDISVWVTVTVLSYKNTIVSVYSTLEIVDSSWTLGESDQTIRYEFLHVQITLAVSLGDSIISRLVNLVCDVNLLHVATHRQFLNQFQSCLLECWLDHVSSTLPTD